MKSELAVLLQNAFQEGKEQSPDLSMKKSELKPGERRDAAVLFLDLAGFTELSGAMDHETVHDITKSIMDQLVLTAQQFTGYVDKIEGDRIMVLFGALNSGENDSQRAISCGFRMLQVLSLAGTVLEPSGVKLSARIGISSGPVTVAPDAIGHLTAMGNTVNIASRMEELADLGTILVTDRVHSLCEHCAVWAQPKTVSVKGVSGQVSVWEPKAALRPECSIMDKTPFVGRKKEYYILKGLLEDASTDSAPDGFLRHTVVEITGDAGTGKVRLAGEFLGRECADRLILKGRSMPHGQPAHWLWSSVLCSLLGFIVQRSVSWEEFTDRLREFCSLDNLGDSLPFLGRLIPSHTDDPRFSVLDKQALALETRLAVRDLLAELSLKQPLAILLEDTQWMDSTDRKVLSFLIENCRTERPILFIITGRNSDKTAPVDRIRENGFYHSFTGIHLEELSREESGELASAVAGQVTSQDHHSFSHHALDMLYTHSSGNPFFLRELVLHLIESGGIQLRGGIWRITDSSVHQSRPESLAGLLQSRLDNLPEDWRSVLLMCSVFGQDFVLDTYRMVSSKLGVPCAENAVFHGLVEKQMLVRSDSGGMNGYRFKHPLIQRTAYQNNLAHNLKLIHKAAAEAMEELFLEDEERVSAKLASHWEGAGNIISSSRWGLLAQKHASDNYQHTIVLYWGNKLLQWLPDNSSDRLKVLERNSSAYQFTGRGNEQLETIRQILELSEKTENFEWMAKANMHLGSFFRASGDLEKAQKHLDLAMELCSQHELTEIESDALGNLGVLAADRRELDKASEFFLRARAIHSELGNKKAEASTLGNLGIMFRNLRDTGKAIEHFREALKIFREMGDIRGEAMTMGNLGNIHHDLKQLEETEELYANALEIFRKIGDRRSQGIFLGNLGILNADRGLDAKAEDYYRRAIAISLETENLRSRGWTLSNLVLLKIKQGQIDPAFDKCSEALELFRKIKDPGLEAISLGALGYIMFIQGNVDESIECYKQTCELISRMKLNPGDFEKTLVRHREEYMKTSDSSPLPLPEHWQTAE